MSWQVVVVHLTGESPLVREPLPEQALPLGSTDDVRRRIEEFFSSVDWSEPTRGHVIASDQTFTLVLNLGNRDPVSSLMIDVRGGSESIPFLVRFARTNGWQIYDCSAGWMDLDNPSPTGWEGYDRLRHSGSPARPQE